MKNFILTGIFIIGVLAPAVVIILLTPTPTASDDLQPRQGAVVIVFDDDAELPPPVISYDFSEGHIPSTQFVALDRQTYSDGALAIKVTLPYLVHPQFWSALLQEIPTVPDWLPIMTSVRAEQQVNTATVVGS